MFFTTSSGAELYYEIKGNPEATESIVFLNGVMASTASWDLATPVFERFGYKIIRHDFKGQLRSSKPVPEKGVYSFAEHALETKELLDFLGADKVNLIGTSYGGEVGMKFAATYPDRVKTLSVIDSVSELDEVCKSFVVGWKLYCDAGGEEFFYGLAPSIYGPDFMETNRDFLKKRAKAMNAADRSYFEGQKILYDTFVSDVYMTDELKNITCPTLVICGQDDILKPQKFSETIYANIENCEFAVFPHCGHVTIFEQPDILNTALLGFVLKNR